MQSHEGINKNAVTMEHLRMIYVTALEDIIRYADGSLQRFVFSRNSVPTHNKLFESVMIVLRAYDPEED